VQATRGCACFGGRVRFMTVLSDLTRDVAGDV
jgi:hypothetical protein